MNFDATISFLKDIAISHEVKALNANIIPALFDALKQDGYSIKNTQPHYLRGLGEELDKPGSSDYTTSLILVIVCVMCAGFASGLTQGLLSLDHMEMTIKARSGTPQEQKFAAKILPVISNHHLLLVTLMLWNASATEALPLFLNKLVPEYVAIIVSVTLVLFVGEIIPASILTGPNQLWMAANLLPLVYCVLVIFFPIAYPISKLLDYFIGHESGVTVYNKKELSAMITLQHEEGVHRHSEGAALAPTMHHEEVAIIGGALKFREMNVSEVMTPIDDTYMISATEKLTAKNMFEIFKSGYSRIPVYDRDKNDVIGLILAKDLIFVDVEDETPVRNFVELFGRKPSVVWHDDKLGETLSMFRAERAHMALVREVVDTGPGDPVYNIVGVITLEDIIEEILGAEINDETDDRDESEFIKSPQFRDMDFARLKLLSNNKVADDQLTSDEVRAIVSHLSTNVPQVRNLFEGNPDGLVSLVKGSSVLKMKRTTPAGSLVHAQEDSIYRRGKVSTMCTLILSGSVTILAGKDEFISERGPWGLLAVDALLMDEGTYTPDFSAFVSSETIRFVSISMSSQHQKHFSHGHHHHHAHAEVHSEGGEPGGTRLRSHSRAQSFVGAHSLAERKLSMHAKKRSSYKDAMGMSATFSAPLLSPGDMSPVDSPVNVPTSTQSERLPPSRSMTAANEEEAKHGHGEGETAHKNKKISFFFDEVVPITVRDSVDSRDGK